MVFEISLLVFPPLLCYDRLLFGFITENKHRLFKTIAFTVNLNLLMYIGLTSK